MQIGEQILEIAKDHGANLAGIANVEALRASASHVIYNQMGTYSGVGTTSDGDLLPPDRLFTWPKTARSILVIALTHPHDLQKLDWWDGKGTPGNRLLMDILKGTRQHIESQLKITTPSSLLR